jgi:PPOX class probable F420-dependent enzyme
MSDAVERLSAGKYLLITSYRRDGTPVATPVWVVRDGDALAVWTGARSGKVKRIRHRSEILVGPCDVRGNPTGAQVPATAELCDPATTERYRQLVTSRYGVIGRALVLAQKFRDRKKGQIGIRITPSR